MVDGPIEREGRGTEPVAHGDGEAGALIVTHLLCTLVVGWLALANNRRRLTAQRQPYIQAWHLGQRVPHPATGIPGTGLGRGRTVQP